MNLIVQPGSDLEQQLRLKRAEYQDRLDRGFHEFDPFMRAMEHTKILIIELLLARPGQELNFMDVLEALGKDPRRRALCLVTGPSDVSSLVESWAVMNRYINDHGAGLINGTGLPDV